MFTGIIKAKGTIRAIERRGGDVRMTIAADELPWSEYNIGDSISVSGVCLTAIELHEDGFDTDVSVETLDVTTLKHAKQGDAVNLEPALRVGDALGGHLVSGHVDGIGRWGTSASSPSRSVTGCECVDAGRVDRSGLVSVAAV